MTAELYENKSGYRILIGMGLCGSWDAQGEGRARWRVLADELGGRNGDTLRQEWESWRDVVKGKVDQLLVSMPAMSGRADLHVVMTPQGQVVEVTPYTRAAKDSDILQTVLIDKLRGKTVKSFPDASHAVEAHVLISVAAVKMPAQK